tara:strand:+ start:232 stop:636 length:405 start_codon:yes stop_codon:yes gene_type:complete
MTKKLRVDQYIGTKSVSDIVAETVSRLAKTGQLDVVVHGERWRGNTPVRESDLTCRVAMLQERDLEKRLEEDQIHSIVSALIEHEFYQPHQRSELLHMARQVGGTDCLNAHLTELLGQKSSNPSFDASCVVSVI